MADGVYITSGVNTLIATDQVNVTGELAHVQYMKLVDATNGSNSLISGDNVYGLDVDVTRIPSITLATQVSPFSTPINVNADDVESLLTTLNAKDFATESTLTTVKNTIATISGHLDGIEGLLGGTIAVTGPLTNAQLRASDVGVTGFVRIGDDGGSITIDGTITANAGTNLNTSALALETTVTSIKTAVEILDNAIAGSEMQVDVVTSALPAGAATSANQTTIIGHVDGIESALAGTLTVANGGTFAVQATQAGTWNVGDGAGSLTVDAVDLDIRNLSALQDFVTISGQLLSTIAGAVAGTEMQVDVITLPNVTLASQASPFSSNVNVNIAATAIPMGGGTQYLEGTTAALPTGTLSFGIRSDNSVRPLSLDDNDYLNVHIAGGPDASLAVYSPTHDAFLCNANMMVEDADVSVLNPVPIDGTVTANAGTNLNTSALALETTAVIIKNTLATISGHVDGIEGQFTTLNAKDFATQTTLATRASESTLSTLNSTVATISGHIDGIESSLTSINSKDFATQTTLALLNSTTTTISGHLDGIETALAGTLTVDNDGTFAVQATQAGTWNIGTLTTITNAVSISDNGGSITVDAVNLDVRDLASTTDYVTISGAVLTSINTAVTDKYTPITATTNIVTSGLINTSAIIVTGPSAGNHLVLYHLKGFNHGGEIRFDIKNGIGGNIIGSYTLASSGGGFNEQYNPPISLATATGLYYSYVSNAYNPNLSITAHFRTVAD